MSAIAGIVGPGKADASTVRAMLQAMSRRAPDGQSIRTGAKAALGHGLLATLAEPVADAQPLTDGDLTIVADVRLDNRAELIEALGPRDPGLSDARLILYAYRRWGADCAAQLLGDFAFAIVDEAQGTLFAARDHAGVKPFYYHAGEARLIFASEVAGVLAAPGVNRTISEARIAEYLAGVPPKVDQTLYGSVLRLSPGHSLRAANGDVVTSAYWSPPTGGAVARKDAPEAFLEVFSRAIDDRMRAKAPVAAMLSGGMDSSSISAVAAPMSARRFSQPLPTYSIVFDKTPALSERPFIEAVLDQGGFAPVFVDADGFSPLARLDRTLEEQGGFYLAPALDLSSHLYAKAAGNGHRVILSGHGGDEVVSQGFGRLLELAGAGRWLKLRQELEAATNIYGNAAGPEFWKYVINFTPLRYARHAWRQARGKISRLKGGEAPVWRAPWSTIVHPDLAARTDVAAAHRDTVGPVGQARNQRDYHLAITDARMQSYGLEVLDRVAGGSGVEVRYPFWDKRVLEFCLSLAPEEILDGGWPRLVLRRAMTGILPDKVLWRRDKLDFTPHMIRGIVTQHHDELDAVILRDRDVIGAYVDLENAAKAWRRVAAAGEAADGHDAQLVWRTAVFARWLRTARAQIA